MPTSLLSLSVSPATWHWPIRVDQGAVGSQRLLLPGVSPSVPLGNLRGGVMEAGGGGHLGWREDGLFAN